MTSDVAVANREGHPVSGGTSPTHIGISVNFIRTDRPARYSSVSRGSFVVHVVVSVAGAIISVPVMVLKVLMKQMSRKGLAQGNWQW